MDKMSSRTKVYEDVDGNASSGRVIALAVVGMAIITYMSTYVFAFMHPDMALAIIGVSSGAFITVTTPTFYFLYNQKKSEDDKELKKATTTTVDATINTSINPLT